MATASEAVAANIRAEVARRTVVQMDLAVALGVSQTGVSKRLRGSIPFSIDEVAQVATFLDVPLVALFEGVNTLALTG